MWNCKVELKQRIPTVQVMFVSEPLPLDFLSMMVEPCVCLCVFVSVCVFLCFCVRERRRNTDRERERQIDRGRDREKEGVEGSRFPVLLWALEMLLLFFPGTADFSTSWVNNNCVIWHKKTRCLKLEKGNTKILSLFVIFLLKCSSFWGWNPAPPLPNIPKK